MSDLDLTPIKDRLARARHLPIFLTGGDIAKARENRKGLYRWHLEGTWDDAVLFGRARDDIAALVAEVERLRERQESHDLANEAIRWERAALDAKEAHDALHDQLDAVRELHYPVEIEPSDTICGECSYQLPNGRYLGKVVEYPSPTIRALGGEQG